MPTCETPNLSIAYNDHGGEAHAPLLLLHGWPDDATTWDAVVAPLVESGRRVIVPTLRGFGETRLNADACRTGNSAMLALDAIALMDALGIDEFDVVGHDWGSNAAEALAVGWPDRIGRMAMMSSPPQLGGAPIPPFEQAQRQWYHWFMATERGTKAVADDRRGFAHLHWVNWSPPGWFDESTFDAVAEAWDNPDWHAVTIHSYRSRWDEAEPDPESAWLADKVKATKTLSVPTLYIHGEADGVNPPSTAKEVPAKFTGPFAAIPFAGVGHFPQREAPEATARVLVHHFSGGDPADLSPQSKDS